METFVRILEMFQQINTVTFLLGLFVLVPLSRIRKLQTVAGIGIVLTALLIGLHLELWTFLSTYAAWGIAGVAAGAFVALIGFIPIAAFTALFGGEWMVLAQILLSVGAFWGGLVYGMGRIGNDDA